MGEVDTFEEIEDGGERTVFLTFFNDGKRCAITLTTALSSSKLNGFVSY